MFQDTDDFNADISNWNTGLNIDMARMFQYATSFNQNLSGWDVSSVLSYTNFDLGATAWTLPKPVF
jgi:surface protein